MDNPAPVKSKGRVPGMEFTIVSLMYMKMPAAFCSTETPAACLKVDGGGGGGGRASQHAHTRTCSQTHTLTHSMTRAPT